MELEALLEAGASLGLTGDDLRRWIDEERRQDREQRAAAERHRAALLAREKMEKERHSLELQERLRQVGALNETALPMGDLALTGYNWDGKSSQLKTGLSNPLLIDFAQTSTLALKFSLVSR